ncbi:MAG: hypothetical protein WCD18_20830 [Thermosynechococcaceae cyanobacterium]
MSQLQLARFQPHPECASGLMTLDDARFLLSQGWLTIEGARYMLPKVDWERLFHARRN